MVGKEVMFFFVSKTSHTMYIYTLSIEMNHNYESGLFKKGTKFSDKCFVTWMM